MRIEALCSIKSVSPSVCLKTLFMLSWIKVIFVVVAHDPVSVYFMAMTLNKGHIFKNKCHISKTNVTLCTWSKYVS